jgi:hypothetical protein
MHLMEMVAWYCNMPGILEALIARQHRKLSHRQAAQL